MPRPVPVLPSSRIPLGRTLHLSPGAWFQPAAPSFKDTFIQELSMRHRLLYLLAAVAVLGISMGCLYPDHGGRRDEGRDQRHEQGPEHRDRDHEERHDDRH
jgi:hypothetical protein